MADDDSDTATAAGGTLSIREPPRVLVPIEVLEGETVPQSLVEFLAPAEVVVLGYHVIPEQTPTEQASMQFEERAREAVEEIAGAFSAAGREVLTRVAFTHDEEQTLERVAEDVGATAVLLPNPSGRIANVLVPLRGAVDVDRLADLVATLLGEAGQVTLWGIAPEEGEELLERCRATLLDRGLAEDRIRTESSDEAVGTHAIVERSDEFDVVVMGEGEQTLLTTVLGETTERIAEGAVAPVLVVRRRRAEEGDGE